MALKDKIKSQFIDVVEFVDDAKEKQLVAKFNRPNDEIKQGAQLIVRPGQSAVFICKGQLADIFQPGNYKLDTGNLPILSTLGAFPYRFNSPMKSDVYFLNTTQFINNKWGTKNPIIKRDKEMGMVRITSFGSYSFRINNAKVFMEEIFGARSLSVTKDIIEYLSSFVAESIAQCLGEMNESVLDLATHYVQLSSIVTKYVNKKAQKIGFEIAEATIENIGLPKEVEQLIDEQSGIGLASRDMDTFIQYQSARAIRDSAKQRGGFAGIGIGTAVGKNVAKTMDKSLNSAPKKETKKKTDDTEPEESMADKIAKYKDLFDREILTQEEFDEVKTMILKGEK